MGKFDEYVGGFTLNVSGKDLTFKNFSVQDKALFFKYRSDVEKLHEHCLSILKRENPDEDPKAIEAFLIENSERFVMALYHHFHSIGDDDYAKYLKGGIMALGFQSPEKSGVGT